MRGGVNEKYGFGYSRSSNFWKKEKLYFVKIRFASRATDFEGGGRKLLQQQFGPTRLQIATATLRVTEQKSASTCRVESNY